MTKLINHSLLLSYNLNRHKTQGFTLVELMVTIVIFGIIISLGLPSFNNILQGIEARDIRSKINSALRTAKIESFTRHQYVIMCLANINNQCDKNATERLIVFTDGDNNHSYDAAQNTLLLIQALRTCIHNHK